MKRNNSNCYFSKKGISFMENLKRGRVPGEGYIRPVLTKNNLSSQVAAG